MGLTRSVGRRAAVLVLLPVLVASVVACATSGGSSTTQPGTAANGATSAPAGDAIRVGTICDCTGADSSTMADWGEVSQAWAQWTNANGGINGHPVKMYVEDDASDPAQNLQAAKVLVEQDHVIAITDGSNVDQGSAAYLKQVGVPVVGGLSFQPTFLSNDDFFTSGSTVYLYLYGEVKTLVDNGTKSLGVMYCAEYITCAGLGNLYEAFAKIDGSKLKVTPLSFSATSPSFDPQCLTLKQAGVQALNIASPDAVIRKIVSACASVGYKPEMILGATSLLATYPQAADADGTVLTSPNANAVDSSVPGVKDYLDAVSKYAPGAMTAPSWSQQLIMGWAGAQLFAAAAKAGGITPSSTPADVKKGLYALKDDTLDGLAPPLTFTPGTQANPACYFTMSISSGEFQTQAGTQPVCVTPAELTAIDKIGG
jgi:branched-chain amino acid transport system substrate-binding protein